MAKKRRKLATWLLIGAFTAVFLLFFRAVEMSANSVSYALDAKSGTLDDLFYAPHLAYSSVIRVFAVVLGAVTSCDTACAGQAHSILWALTAVVCMYLLVRHLTESEGVALIAAASLLVSHGFWVFATQLEVYVPLVGSQLLLATVLILAWTKWPGVLFVASCAGIWTLATLYHQATAVFAVPLAAYLITKHGRQGAIRAAAICTLAGVTVILAYLGAHIAIDADQPFVPWVVGLANTELTDWGSFGNWNFAGFKTGLYSQVSSLIVVPGELRPSQIPVQWRGGLLVLAILAWNAVRVFRRAAHLEARLFFLLWFCAYFLFFTWWDPRVLKFFVPSAVPLVALGAFSLHDFMVAARRITERRGYPKWVLDGVIGVVMATALAVTFVFNLVGSVLPVRGNVGPTLGPHYEEARLLNRYAPNECVVSGFGHELLYLTYYYADGTRPQGRSIRDIYEAYYDDVLSENRAQGERRRPRPFVDESCVLINMRFLSERFFTWKTRPEVYARSASGPSPEWQVFLDWFFQVDSEEQSETVTFDAFRLILHEDRAPYVLIDRRLREQAPGDHIAQTLTTALDMYGDQFEINFAGRDRDLIFGYSGNHNVAEPAAMWPTLLEFVKSSDRVPPLVR